MSDLDQTDECEAYDAQLRLSHCTAFHFNRFSEELVGKYWFSEFKPSTQFLNQFQALFLSFGLLKHNRRIM